jgi:hypothetical protein
MNHYYHIAAVNDWKRIVDEHFLALCTSGLHDALDEIVVGIVGSPNAREAVRDRLNMWKKVRIMAEAGEGCWEQLTLMPLWAAARHESGPVLYGHTKGVWNQSAENEEWRAAMIRHLVTRWPEATKLLDIADVVGTHRIDDSWPYDLPERWGGTGAYRSLAPNGADWQTEARRVPVVYIGNWWWTTMEWIATLPQPLLNHRFDAQQWIGSTQGHPPMVVVTQPGKET